MMAVQKAAMPVQWHSLRSGVFIFMENKLFKLITCTTRVDFLNLIFPGKGAKDEYLKVIFGIPDQKKYKEFEITKKSGGMRKIVSPIPELKYIQKRLSIFLTDYYHELFGEKNIYSNGFLKDKSIITNAKIHRGKKFILNTDLEDFFPSITFGRVRNFFIKNKNFNLTPEIATLIAKIACYNGYLPQGSPCSPIISNFICQILDIRLGNLAKKNFCSYSRYADDITFSTNMNQLSETIAYWDDEKILLGKSLVSEITHAGFKINYKKTRLYDKTQKQEVTSLVVNKKVNVSRKYFDDTKAMARNYYLNGICDINGTPGTSVQILGRFNFINQLEKYNNKIYFKNNEKDSPKNIFTSGNGNPSETNQKDNVYAPIQLTYNSTYHTMWTENMGKNNTNKSRYGYKLGYESLSAREQAYSKFLYYSTFIINPRPIIITEGKTDILYIKSALKNLYLDYPELIERKDNKFKFKISFYNYTKLNRYLLNIVPSGSGVFRVLKPLYLFPKNSIVSSSSVILLLDNEETKGKPLAQLMGNLKLKRKILDQQFSELDSSTITQKGSDKLFSRLEKPKFFLLTIPKNNSQKDADIETLFTEEFLKEYDFSRTPKKEQNGKNSLSKIVAKEYRNIDFSLFKPLLDNLVNIVNMAIEK